VKRPTTIDWNRIEAFIGYGNIEAPIVFVGVEEGLAKPEALQQDLLWRSTFSPVMDVKEAHEGLADDPRLFAEKARDQKTWRVMTDVMLHFNSETFKSKQDRKEQRKTYRKLSLGRTRTNSLLMELLPYPNKKKAAWPYGDRFATKKSYVAGILPRRLDLISHALGEHPRNAIICYGQGEWRLFKQLFPPDTKWKGIKGSYNTFECATWRGAKVTLTYHFSRYFNTDEQLDELSAVALSKL
jgi:hypothetical protein